MKLEKHVMRFVNLLLAAFFAFGVLQFLEQFSNYGWEWYSRTRLCWPILLCFVTGVLGRSLPRWKYPLMGLSAGFCTALLILRWPGWGFMNVAYLVCAIVMACVLYLLGLRGEEPFPPKLAVASMLVYIGACLFFFLGDYRLADFQPLCWCGLAAFCLSLYSFNAASLHTGVHNVKGGEVMAIPTGIRGKNLTMLTLFLIAAVFIGSLSVLQQFLNGAWHWFLAGVGMFIRFLTNIAGGGEIKVSSQPSPTPEPTQEPGLANLGEQGDPTFAAVYGILLAVCGVVFLLLAYGFVKEGRKGGAGRRFAEWMRGLFRTRQILEYEDDVERTADLRSLLAEQGKKTRHWLRRLREKPERFEDMPNDRMRLRFAYRALLKSGRVAGWTAAATPKEVGESMETPAFRALTEAYCAARYDLENEVPPEQAAAAAEALRALGRRGRE